MATASPRARPSPAESMRDLNGRAFIADCKKGYKTPDQPPDDYFSFDPDDWISVFWHAYAVYRCIDDVRKKARKDRRDVPTIEALPQAIRGCSRRLLMEYLEDWARGRACRRAARLKRCNLKFGPF